MLTIYIRSLDKGPRSTTEFTIVIMVSAFLLISLFSGFALAEQTTAPIKPKVEVMPKIYIVSGTHELTATLDNNQAAKEFLSLLPITLTLTDYANTEKVSALPKRFSTKGTPPGYDPSVGDITYYAPWGNLAIFYRDFGYARGLVRLGTIEGNIEILKQPGPVPVKIFTLDK